MQPAMSPYHVYAINRPMSGPSRVAGQQNLRQNTLAKQRASPIHNFQHILYEQHIGTSPKNIESATASPPPPLIGSKPQRHQIVAATSREFAGYTTVDPRRCLLSITIIISHLLNILIFAFDVCKRIPCTFYMITIIPPPHPMRSICISKMVTCISTPGCPAETSEHSPGTTEMLRNILVLLLKPSKHRLHR